MDLYTQKIRSIVDPLILKLRKELYSSGIYSDQLSPSIIPDPSWEDIQNVPDCFIPCDHDHDDTYYTETEVDALISGYSELGHDHDDTYYTETEVDALISGISPDSTFPLEVGDYLIPEGKQSVVDRLTVSGVLTINGLLVCMSSIETEGDGEVIIGPSGELMMFGDNGDYMLKSHYDSDEDGIIDQDALPTTSSTTSGLVPLTSGFSTSDYLRVSSSNNVEWSPINPSSLGQEGASDGQTIVWDSASEIWEPKSPGPPTGTIVIYAGTTAPTGWLMCNGQAISRTTYSGLFYVCGTYFGSGDGSTTFNLPDLRGRFPFGSDATHSLGASAGEEYHTLTPNELSAHDHRLHYRYFQLTGLDYYPGSGWSPLYFAGTIPLSGSTNLNTTTESPHNNMPPFLNINFIIKG